VDNLLRPTSAVFNIGLDKLRTALSFFSQYSALHEDILRDSPVLVSPVVVSDTRPKSPTKIR
jgi:hypothetical protein